MEQYKKLIKDTLEQGRKKKDRTGTGTISMFGNQVKFNMADGFPLLTLKRTFMRGISEELLWFIKGETNIKYLVDQDVHIWDEWAYKKYRKMCEEGNIPHKYMKNDLQNSIPFSQKEFIDFIKTENSGFQFESNPGRWRLHDLCGDLGPIYGKQWRKWQDWMTYDNKNGRGPQLGSIWHDQLGEAIHTLRTNPTDRGIIVNSWNVNELEEMALRPCHCMFQFHTEELTLEERQDWYIANKKMFLINEFITNEEAHKNFDALNIPKYKLNLQLYQRSADLMLGVPFNIASYALLLHMVAHITNMLPGEFIHTFGDLHIYNNHLEAAEEVLKRESFPLPQIVFKRSVQEIDDFKIDDFEIINYVSHPSIKLPVAV